MIALSQVPTGWTASELSNLSQRFALWARSSGLHDTSHASLDYRFRDAPNVLAFATKLLNNLAKSLSAGMFSY